jgi:hypothetical protein
MTSGLGKGTGHHFGSGWISGVLAVPRRARQRRGPVLLFPSWLTAIRARSIR